MKKISIAKFIYLFIDYIYTGSASYKKLYSTLAPSR